jgi:hypothetical protein
MISSIVCFLCLVLMYSELGRDARRSPGIDRSVVIAVMKIGCAARGATESQCAQVSCLIRACGLPKAQCVAHSFLLGPQIAE